MNKEVGERIRQIRRSKEMTLKDVAKKTGYSYQAIGQYERGERNVGWEQARLIARALDCKPIDFLGRELGSIMRPDNNDVHFMYDPEAVNWSAPAAFIDPLHVIVADKEGNIDTLQVSIFQDKIDNITQAINDVIGPGIGPIAMQILSAYSHCNEDGRKRLLEMIQDFASIPKYLNSYKPE